MRTESTDDIQPIVNLGAGISSNLHPHQPGYINSIPNFALGHALWYPQIWQQFPNAVNGFNPQLFATPNAWDAMGNGSSGGGHGGTSHNNNNRRIDGEIVDMQQAKQEFFKTKENLERAQVKSILHCSCT